MPGGHAARRSRVRLPHRGIATRSSTQAGPVRPVLLARRRAGSPEPLLRWSARGLEPCVGARPSRSHRVGGPRSVPCTNDSMISLWAVETRRLELPTSCVQSRRSSQLSYVPAGGTVRWHSIVGLLTGVPARRARSADRVVRTHRRDLAAPSHGPRDPNSQLLVTCRRRSSVRFASALPLSVPATASIAWMISLPISSRRSASAVASAATTALWRRSTASASE